MSVLKNITNDVLTFVNYLAKLAAIEWSEEAEWIPKGFKEFDIFKNFPKAKPEKIFSDFGFKYLK